MKCLIAILFLTSTLRLDAALTVTSRGTYALGGSSSTIIFVPSSTIAAGTLGVLLAVTPNIATGGSTKIFTASSFTDSVGNTWTRQMDAIYDPGASSAGVEIAAYTGVIATQVTTSDNVTVTISPTAINKVAMVWEVSGANGTPTYVTSAPVSDLLTSGQTGTAVSVTSSSITSGDAIIAWNGGRSNSAPSAVDTDTTNGSWSTAVQISVAINYLLVTQYKVTTGSGAQTWDITQGASVAWECGWIQIREAVSGVNTTNGFFLWQ